MQNSVSAVIILYNPDLEHLKASVELISTQVKNVILIDNSEVEVTDSFFSFPKFVKDKLSYFLNKNDGGIAKAQNIGIESALEKGADYILILDQDSLPTSNLVESLLDDYLLLTNQGIKLAAIGPEHINKQTNLPYKPRIVKRKSFENFDHILKVSEIMSSGSLIKKDVLSDIGLMDEKLFIDAVDHEWCWRAGSKGYTCAITKKANLGHMLGEGDKKLLGMNVAITSSFRVFYQYRNFIYLCSVRYVPTYWKINNAFKYTVKFFYFSLFLPDGKSYFKNMVKGIKAGFKVLQKK